MSATVPTEPGVEALKFSNHPQPGDVASLDRARYALAPIRAAMGS